MAPSGHNLLLFFFFLPPLVVRRQEQHHNIIQKCFCNFFGCIMSIPASQGFAHCCKLLVLLNPYWETVRGYSEWRAAAERALLIHVWLVIVKAQRACLPTSPPGLRETVLLLGFEQNASDQSSFPLRPLKRRCICHELCHQLNAHRFQTVKAVWDALKTHLVFQSRKLLHLAFWPWSFLSRCRGNAAVSLFSMCLTVEL